jgi:GNAT superfamily N-acetyltransferase
MSESVLPLTVFGAHGIASYLDDQFSDQSGGNAEFLIASRDDTLLGAEELRHRQGLAFINHIYVHPEYQGRGIGGQLILNALRRAGTAATNDLALDVEVDNHVAIGWYGRLGLEIAYEHAIWSYDLAGCDVGTDDLVLASAQQQSQFARYGFCRIQLRSASRAFEVGLLGQDYYKTSDSQLLQDTTALSALRAYDPRRQLLFSGTLPEGISDGDCRKLVGFYRMKGLISNCMRYLVGTQCQ